MIGNNKTSFYGLTLYIYFLLNIYNVHKKNKKKYKNRKKIK